MEPPNPYRRPPQLSPYTPPIRTLPDGEPVPAARATDPETSHEAARRLTSRHTDSARLLDAYSRYRALTDAEAGRIAKVPTSHKRCAELVRYGWIEKVGTVQANGRPCRICRITGDGWIALLLALGEGSQD